MTMNDSRNSIIHSSRRYEAPGYRLIGVSPDGTRHCLLSGLLSMNLAERVRQCMVDGDAYADYLTILIEHKRRRPEGSMSTSEPGLRGLLRLASSNPGDRLAR